MPTKRIPFGDGYALITFQENWKPGDMPPADKSDYLAQQEWAEVQIKAKLRQVSCGHCGKWFFPQELSTKTIVRTAYKDKAMTKPVTITEAICLKCERAKP